MDLQDGKRMLGDIKSKLGFGSKGRGRNYEEDAYDEYDEYAEDYDGYDDGYDDYDDYDDGYEAEPAPSSRRPSRYDADAAISTRPAGSRSSRSAGYPRLVSIEDVRANTQLPSSLTRDPLPPRRVTSASSEVSSLRGNRTMVDSSLPPQMTPEGTAAEAVSASRRRSSEGLESLFTPTTDASAGERPDASAPASSGPVVTTRAAYDPFESYTGYSTANYNASRSVTVLKPASYGEVERVAKALKAGDAVVLCLRNTPDNLAKRLLDFSFGVASALDASVECIADKVFAITRGKDLTDAERSILRAQGVL